MKTFINTTETEKCQPEHKQNHLKKIEKLKEPKLNKNILIAKTLEAFKPKAKYLYFPLKKSFLQICSKPIFISEIGPVLYLQDLKNIHSPLTID